MKVHIIPSWLTMCWYRMIYSLARLSSSLQLMTMPLRVLILVPHCTFVNMKISRFATISPGKGDSLFNLVEHVPVSKVFHNFLVINSRVFNLIFNEE